MSVNAETLEGYINRKLGAVGVPVGYRRFKGEDIPAIPYIVYFFERERFTGSDTKNRACRTEVVVELYTADKAFSMEKTLETEFSAHEMEKAEEFDTADEIFRVTYEFTVTTKIREGEKYIYA